MLLHSGSRHASTALSLQAVDKGCLSMAQNQENRSSGLCPKQLNLADSAGWTAMLDAGGTTEATGTDGVWSTAAEKRSGDQAS